LAAIPFPVTHEELADLLGVQRTTVTMIARTRQAEGIVQVRRGRMQIRSIAALERVRVAVCKGTAPPVGNLSSSSIDAWTRPNPSNGSQAICCRIGGKVYFKTAALNRSATLPCLEISAFLPSCEATEIDICYRIATACPKAGAARLPPLVRHRASSHQAGLAPDPGKMDRTQCLAIGRAAVR
jgi:hypothetical protein